MSHPFHTHLVTQHNIADSKQTLFDRLDVDLQHGEVVEVPVGFETDLASTPKILWSFYPPMGRYSYPAVVHDWLYAGGLIHRNGMVRVPSRREADRILRELMRRCGCRWYTCWIFWLMVRCFGGSHWSERQ